jgi:O-antigen ligase
LCLISSVFLALNIFSQHIVGFDIFGHPPFAERFNGLFESEAIAGSYIQKLSILSILSVVLLDITEWKKKLLILFIINILGIGVLLTFDRMPFVIYLFSILISIILIKNIRLNFFISFLIFILLTSTLFKNYEILYERYSILKYQISLEKIVNLIQKVKNNNSFSLSDNSKKTESGNISISGDYIKLYYSAYNVWLNKPWMGSGVKSFGPECLKLLINKNININNINCSTHPHNIYLEILVNIGGIGMLTFLLVTIIILKDLFSNIDLKIYNNKKSILSIFFLIILIIELIPIRSYGSIFQTVNGSMFWFLLSLISSIKWIKLDKINFSHKK